MKQLRRSPLLACFLSLTLGLTACTIGKPSAQQPTETQPTSPIENPTPAPTSTLVPLELAGPQAGARMLWLDGGLLVYVPPGEFSMGQPSGQDNPLHKVFLDGYWIGQTEVTNRMYTLCVVSGVCTPPASGAKLPNYTDPDIEDHPVVAVTWEQAQDYCQWMGGSLPSEAQWEKAARGPQPNPYPWGQAAPSCDLLNFEGCLGGTSNVTNYLAGQSGYGHLDMAGNVSEWTADWYSPDYYQESPTSDPRGPQTGTQRSVRGSSFESGPAQVASAMRSSLAPDGHAADLGFRCVVQNPPRLAPYCHSQPTQPQIALPQPGNCMTPTYRIVGTFCQEKRGYVTVDLNGPVGFLTSEGLTCQLASEKRIACYGRQNSSGTLSACLAGCANPTPAASQTPDCTPGYRYSPVSGLCVYTPAASPALGESCPSGFLDLGGGRCLPVRGADGLCPPGQYFDQSLGACAPSNITGSLLYGLDLPSQAQTTYQGCLPGFSYDPNSQCCQVSSGGMYPECELGYYYDYELKRCIPGSRQPTGCITFSVAVPPCVVANCSQYKNAGSCRKYTDLGCYWNGAACLNK
jgi:formylglycine-generating enzyme required for sulfatase activity